MAKLAKLMLQYSGHVRRVGARELALAVLEGSIEGNQHQGSG